MKKILLSIAIITGMSSCSQDDDGGMAVQDFPAGTNYSFSNVESQNAYAQLKQNLQANDAIGIVAEVDHQQNAQSIGENIDYTKIIFFGNPNLGTTLMQKNQLAGLDLPQKILFYKNDGRNTIIYNSVDYLSSRHDLDGVGTLDQISGALENLVTGVSNSEILNAEDQMISFKEGIITKSSTKNFDETYQSLKTALSSNENISIITELDHQKNAESVGMELDPTKIIVFGNPNLGTPLMMEDQSIGLDLPQKMLVWENENGDVFVSYNDPDFIAERHNIEGSEDVLSMIANALDNLSKAATTN